MSDMEEDFQCKPWCDETPSETWHECAMNVRLYDKRHYAVDDAVVQPDSQFAEQVALFARFMPPETDLMNLFVTVGEEDGDPVDMAIELWRLAKGVDDPSATLSMDLHGLKDLHQAVGQAIALLEE